MPRLDVVKVAISRGKPRWRLSYRYRVLPELAPSREAFGIEDMEEFERAYRSELEEAGMKQITQALRKISDEHGGKPLVLLCWERPGELCHRRVWADWFKQKAEIEVPELVPGMVLPGRDAPTQEALFEYE